MTTTLAPAPVFRQWDNNGNPLAGGQLFTYAAGTSTPIPTYTDSTGVTQNSNPVILNNRGEAQVWLQPNVAYKFQLTDSQGNQIPGFPIDQIVNSQLLTLYGGVDTGVANAYVINFTANFNAYTDGVIVYFVASNANTAASTININGLGVIALTNQDGTALRAGEILANSVIGIMIKGGAALLLTGNIASGVLAVNGSAFSPSVSWANANTSGLYLANPSTGEIGVSQGGTQVGNIYVAGGAAASATVVGVTGTTGISVAYTLNLNVATVIFPCFSGAGTGTAFTITFSAPSALFLPSTANAQWIMVPSMQDNGSNLYAQTATLVNQGSPLTTSMKITFNKNGNPAGWTATGARGLGDSTSANQFIALSWVVGGTS